MDSKQVQRYIFLGVFLFLFGLTVVLFYPFLSMLLWAGILYVITLPLYDRIVGRFAVSKIGPLVRTVTAGTLSLLCLCLVVIPAVFIGVTVFIQLREFVQAAVRFLEENRHVFETIKGESFAAVILEQTGGLVDLRNIDIKTELTRLISGSSGRIFSFSQAAFRNVAGFGLSLAFLVFSLYFFYIDGAALIRTAVDMMPIDRRYTVAFLRRFRDTVRHLLRGYIAVAVYQGVAAFVIFSVFRQTSPLFLAVLVSLTSFIPMVGTAIVWGPVAIMRLVTGDIVGGIALGVACGFFISIMDNFLRPFLLHEKIKIHPLLIFFSILGGVRLAGFNGVIIGPIILILFFAAMELFEEAFGQRSEKKLLPHSDDQKP